MREKNIQKEGKRKKVSKPYADVLPIREVKKRLRSNISASYQENLLDEMMYRSHLFYLNLMDKIKRKSEIIWSIILFSMILYIMIWFIRNM